MIRLLCLLFAFAVSAPVAASWDSYEYEVQGRLGVWYPTRDAACEAFMNWKYPTEAYKRWSFGGVGTYNSCYVELSTNGTTWAGVDNAIFGRRSAGPCPDGELRDSETGVCVPPPCQAGQTATVRAWVGYATTINNVDDWISPRLPTSAMSGSNCQVGSLSIVPGSCTVSPDLGGPPYPGSCEFTGTTTGDTAGASDLTFDDPLQPIPCPAGTAIGSVNGVSGCYKTSSSSSSSSTTTNGDGSTTKVTTTVNPDGSTTTTTTTTNPDGSQTVSRVVTGSTPGGGSGALPGQGTSTGSGSDGSGAGGAAGGDGDSEQAKFCQDNPNAAMCKDKVKVDEEGTPGEKTDWGGEQSTLQTAIDAIKGEVERGDWKQLELGFAWNPPIPSGGCSAVQVFNQSIDICLALSRARELWGWVIYVLAALAIWIRGVRALQGV